MQKQIGTLGIVLFGGWGFCKILDQPVYRPFNDMLGPHCVGDPVDLWAFGKHGKCDKPIAVGTTINNLKNNTEDHVFLCSNHMQRIDSLDWHLSDGQKIRWQDLPFPRTAPHRQLYQHTYFCE